MNGEGLLHWMQINWIPVQTRASAWSSFLNRKSVQLFFISGFDIIREINERFHVTIPLARVYTYLYELEKNKILTTTLRGNLRIYSPTKEGVVYIKGRLSEINTAYDQVLGTKR